MEYLWLTLDYNQFHDKNVMKKTVVIEHSECLTSEDTAKNEGASSEREPDNYKVVGLNMDPVSEDFHEYIYFPSADMVDTMKPYLDYMYKSRYINDGNPVLERKGFINNKSKENSKPLYVTKYKDKYGKTNYFTDDSITWNDVAKLITNKARAMNISDLNLSYNKNKTVVEINDLSLFLNRDDNTLDNTKIIALIIRLLTENKTVVYNPTSVAGYKSDNYKSLYALNKDTKNSLELIFTPEFNNESESINFFYKPTIQINQPILFKPAPILIKFLTMFLSLDDLSKYLSHGSYEFMSRVRVGYNINSKTSVSKMKGGSHHSNSYNKGIDMLYNQKYGGDNKMREINDKFTKRVKINNNNRKTRKL
jgi:hypothetical protein